MYLKNRLVLDLKKERMKKRRKREESKTKWLKKIFQKTMLAQFKRFLDGCLDWEKAKLSVRQMNE